MTDLRDRTAEALERLAADDGVLHVDSELATWRRFGVGDRAHRTLWTVERARLHADLLATFMARQEQVPRDGLAAVVTAGPPAGGKSTAINDDPNLKMWRRIDADVFKAMLIEATMDEPSFGALIGLKLVDDQSVMPMELAGLVHHESTFLADRALARSLYDHENVIIEGTLSWEGQPPRLATDLGRAGYAHLTVLLAEAPRAIVQERALSRWWTARQEGLVSGGLGGRFTPASTIDSIYDIQDFTHVEPGDFTRCAANARRLVAEAQGMLIEADLVRTGSTPPTQ